MDKEFSLPDVGEGLTEADIVTWRVKPGDAVKVNQVIVDIETAKAVVELPSPWDGVVSRLLVEEGQTVDVGTPIVAIEVSNQVPNEPAAPEQRQPVLVGYGVKPGSVSRRPRKKNVTPPGPPVPPSGATRPAPDGTNRHPTGRDPGRVPARGATPGPPVPPSGATRGLAKPSVRPPAPPSSSPDTSSSPRHPTSSDLPLSPSHLSPSSSPFSPSHSFPPSHPFSPGHSSPPDISSPDLSSPSSHPSPASSASPSLPPRADKSEISGLRGARALAKPPVRKLARDLGVDLTAVTGTGPQGSVTRDDVQRAAVTPNEAEGIVRSVSPNLGVLSGEAAPVEERIPVKGVRKHTAAAMVHSAFTAPHVTEFLQVDVTETMAAVRRVRELPEFSGIRVSPLLFVARALLVAAARHPMINASWDEEAQEIVVKRDVNLGIAVASDRGLLVPNVRSAQALSLPALASALDTLAATARAGKATPADLSGGTITITNVGVFGVDAGTPILTPGEAAILAFGQVRDMPWVVDGSLAVRKVTTLSLSFDHRIVDGELGSAVLRDIGAMLEDPVRMLAWLLYRAY